MLGHKAKLFKTHPAVSIEELVPLNNFYRKVEAKVDLTFVRDLVKDSYSSRMGRPSIDPVVFFKLQLIMFFEGFRSERQLMEQVNLNWSFARKAAEEREKRAKRCSIIPQVAT